MTFEALGTQWHIDALGLDQSVETLLYDEVRRFESSYSRFGLDSEVTKLNTNKHVQNPSQEFMEMLSYALAMYDATRGLFNISVAAELENNGYGIGLKGAHISRDLRKDIVMSNQAVKISEDTLIDFGGFGKGWLIDKLAQMLEHAGIHAYLINGGGDILVGQHAETLYIEHPTNHQQYVGNVVVKDGALASSSKSKRVWESPDGITVNHIVDPVGSEQRSDNIASVHVRADRALDADVFGTVMLIADSKQKKEFIDQYNLQILVINHDLTFTSTADFGFRTQ